MSRISLRKGSVLVYTLLLLSMMLVAALSLATTAIIGKRGALSTDKSMQAFQTADSGAEVILAKIKNAVNTDNALSTLGSCSGGKITGTVRGDYAVSFFGVDTNGNEKTLTCSDKISDITKIKSSGSFGETTRAIETAVAAGGEYIVSCTGGNNNYCFRMNTDTGKTECRYLNASGVSGTYSIESCPDPWSGTGSNGPYSVSCTEDSGHNISASCVRVDKNGKSETKFWISSESDFRDAPMTEASAQMW